MFPIGVFDVLVVWGVGGTLEVGGSDQSAKEARDDKVVTQILGVVPIEENHHPRGVLLFQSNLLRMRTFRYEPKTQRSF